MTSQWQHDEFKEKTDTLPALPLRSQTGAPTEFAIDVSSKFIDGVNVEDEPAHNFRVDLTRFANNNPDYGNPVLEYVVSIELGPRACPITMSPQAAIHLGSFLIQAGTAALRDLAENSAFLAEGVTA